MVIKKGVRIFRWLIGLFGQVEDKYLNRYLLKVPFVGRLVTAQNPLFQDALSLNAIKSGMVVHEIGTDDVYTIQSDPYLAIDYRRLAKVLVADWVVDIKFEDGYTKRIYLCDRGVVPDPYGDWHQNHYLIPV